MIKFGENGNFTKIIQIFGKKLLLEEKRENENPTLNKSINFALLVECKRSSP